MKLTHRAHKLQVKLTRVSRLSNTQHLSDFGRKQIIKCSTTFGLYNRRPPTLGGHRLAESPGGGIPPGAEGHWNHSLGWEVRRHFIGPFSPRGSRKSRGQPLESGKSAVSHADLLGSRCTVYRWALEEAVGHP